MKKEFECTRDSLIIKGIEYRKNSDKCPALILSHGFLANQGMCKDYAILAANLGYAAFTFDFNGGGIGTKSTGKSVDMTVETEVKDLLAVYEYVASKEDVDSVVLLGCSQGGVVSSIVASRLQQKIKGLILLYPAFCIPDDARKGRMLMAHFDPDNVPEIILRVPMKLSGQYAKCVMAWSLQDMTGNYSGPVLYLHGTKDDIVNIDYARKAAKDYINIEYHEIEGGRHMFSGKYDQQAQEYIQSFLKGVKQ